MKIDLYHGDCLEVLRILPDNSIDSIVTDPPYGLSQITPEKVTAAIVEWASGNREVVPAGRGFMGKDWDGFVPPPAVWDECLRVLKPGGHMAVFAGSRTQDVMGISIRMAGFEIRDTLGWIYGSGFPKSMNVEKAVESTILNGKSNSRTLRKTEQDGDGESYELKGRNNGILGEDRTYDRKEFTSTTEDAKRWSGWGTALKPAIEPIILARKPLDGTVANNVLTHGVGGLNIDACRVGTANTQRKNTAEMGYHGGNLADSYGTGSASGRFPANVLLDEHAAEEMDEQSGVSKSQRSTRKKAGETVGNGVTLNNYHMNEDNVGGYSDTGGASRFFPVFKYQAKAPKKERPVVEREDGSKIQHPTVKPVALMEWLTTLITPPGGTVLDPFAGSGTTLQAARDNGFTAIGIEQDPEYIQLIEQRVPNCQLISTE